MSGIGAIAQLGERLLCKQEVVGSIPSGSTTHVRVRGVEPKASVETTIRATSLRRRRVRVIRHREEKVCSNASRSGWHVARFAVLAACDRA